MLVSMHMPSSRKPQDRERGGGLLPPRNAIPSNLGGGETGWAAFARKREGPGGLQRPLCDPPNPSVSVTGRGAYKTSQGSRT